MEKTIKATCILCVQVSLLAFFKHLRSLCFQSANMSPPNSRATIYGGAGGRGARASVSTPKGLRNMLRTDRSREALCIEHMEFYTESRTSYPLTPPLEDVKLVMHSLNLRLGNYVHLVRKLEEENQEAQKKIDIIVAKRKDPKGQDWEKIWESLDEFEKQIENRTVENAGLLIQIEMARLASEDFKNKYDDEVKAKKVLEKELEKLKKKIIDTEMNKIRVHSEITLVNETIEKLMQEHKQRVDVLLERIKKCVVKVEVESSSSSMAEIIDNIRARYKKAAEKNLRETEAWYKKMFMRITVEKDTSTQTLDAEKTKKKELLQEKKTLEIQIKSQRSSRKTLEETVRKTKLEYSQKTISLYDKLEKMKVELNDLINQVNWEEEKNEQLTDVTDKLKGEIQTYKDHLNDISEVIKRALIDLNDQLIKPHIIHGLGDEKAKIPDVAADVDQKEATPKK